MTDAQKAFIIGGSTGMGLATAQALSDRGFSVAIGGRGRARLDAAVAQLGPSARGLTVDMTDEASLERAFVELGAFDHLVLAGSAGVAWGPIGDVTGAQLADAVSGKLVAYWNSIRLALPHLRAGGSITIFSGAASRKAMPGTAALAAVNGGLNALGHTLAVELAPTRVNVLSPGLVDTTAYDGMPAEGRREMMTAAAARVPIGRLGTADEVGRAAAMVVDNPYLSGALLDCDGGTRL